MMQRGDGWSSRLLVRKLSLTCAKPVRKAHFVARDQHSFPNQCQTGYCFENIVSSRVFLLVI